MSRFKKLSHLLQCFQNKMVFRRIPHLKQERCCGNQFRRRSFVGTVSLDAGMIRKYVKYQKAKERKKERSQVNL